MERVLAKAIAAPWRIIARPCAIFAASFGSREALYRQADAALETSGAIRKREPPDLQRLAQPSP